MWSLGLNVDSYTHAQTGTFQHLPTCSPNFQPVSPKIGHWRRGQRRWSNVGGPRGSSMADGSNLHPRDDHPHWSLRYWCNEMWTFKGAALRASPGWDLQRHDGVLGSLWWMISIGKFFHRLFVSLYPMSFSMLDIVWFPHSHCGSNG